MAVSGEMVFHEAANIFPLDDDSLPALADDIKANGQQVAIELLDGKVLDGRRRWLACKMAGVKPVTKDVNVADPVAYVLSLNLHRRHLTTSQASACAARAEELHKRLADEAQERKKRKPADSVRDNCPAQNGRTRDQIGAMFGVSGKSVERARQVIDKGIPELVKAIDDGKLSVNKAQYIATQDKSLQSELLDAEMGREQHRQKHAKPAQQDDDEQPSGERRGVGIIRANEAINCLIRIPKNDALRKRGFQLVTDWIRKNK
jgi:hypothetical protein